MIDRGFYSVETVTLLVTLKVDMIEIQIKIYRQIDGFIDRQILDRFINKKIDVFLVTFKFTVIEGQIYKYNDRQK